MPVADTGTQGSLQKHTNGSSYLSSTDLSLSQSISASASDLRLPASTALEGQTASRSKEAKLHYGKAARAFLQKDHLTALIESQQAVKILSTANDLGRSLTASASWPEHNNDLDKLIEKVAILRLTVLTHVYTDVNAKQEMLDQLSKSQDVGVDQLKLLLCKQPTSMINHLWFEVLRLCSQTSGEFDAPTLDPTPETIDLAVQLPSAVISSAVLAALRLDSLDRSAKTGSLAARQIAEWYLASYSSVFHVRPPTEKALAAYEKIVGLYALHVLATRLGEWEYAREFVGYASLPESTKFALLEQINDAHTHLLQRPEREQEAAAAAQLAYQAEKTKRASQEKAAQADIAKSVDTSNTSASFLSSKDVSRAAEASRTHTQDTSASPPSSGSDPGRSGAARSQSPAYFAPRGNVGAGSSTATSPAISPGSSRSSRHNSASSPPETEKVDRRSSKRLSRSYSNQDGNESSTSAHDKSGRKAGADKDDTSYASTRAHLSRYVKKEHDGKPQREDRDGLPRAASAQTPSILSMIKSAFDLRRSQSRSYFMSAIVMLLVFYRVSRRPAAGQNVKAAHKGVTGATSRNTAAQNARNKLVARNQSAGGVLGIGWILLVWKRVLETVKM